MAYLPGSHAAVAAHGMPPAKASVPFQARGGGRRRRNPRPLCSCAGQPSPAVAGMDHGHGRSDPSIDDDDLMRARARARAPPLLRPVAAAWPNQPSAAGVVLKKIGDVLPPFIPFLLLYFINNIYNIYT
jgi:hypothetical protein